MATSSYRNNSVSGQAGQLHLGTGVAEAHLRAQHEHAQALERRSQDVAAADQQETVAAVAQADEARQHAAFGRTPGGQARLIGAEQGEILGHLALQKTGGVFALHPDHAEVGQGGDAVQGGGGGVGHG